MGTTKKTGWLLTNRKNWLAADEQSSSPDPWMSWAS
jgi:hypothetical protein